MLFNKPLVRFFFSQPPARKEDLEAFEKSCSIDSVVVTAKDSRKSNIYPIYLDVAAQISKTESKKEKIDELSGRWVGRIDQKLSTDVIGMLESTMEKLEVWDPISGRTVINIPLD